MDGGKCGGEVDKSIRRNQVRVCPRPIAAYMGTNPSCNSLLDEEECRGSAEASKLSAVAQPRLRNPLKGRLSDAYCSTVVDIAVVKGESCRWGGQSAISVRPEERQASDFTQGYKYSWRKEVSIEISPGVVFSPIISNSDSLRESGSKID
ncbi:uncharacterized protein K444DRAFT_69880 [Hyaloscypha bicolor E]|uniref:Uncharacterized protein n=1 Tax=Hyaloscypha bicolor E TaxID=1095630 RepID=A0A2J6T0T8_9HELO|nr:uncharacterized protein K444DRAFT_69880 [Hyaloscypha bicolor E]PMD56619.1 hypothetical protein K444DRAFT_69880 [Hyaloscypha bicolor E]